MLEFLNLSSWLLGDKHRKPNEQTQIILMKLNELAARLTALDVRIDKVQAEILAEIQKLKDALGDVDVPEAASTAIANIEAKVGSLDDRNADV